MRTMLTLDDDVAAMLKAEARRTGRPFGEVVNETLAAGWRADDLVRRSRPGFRFAISATSSPGSRSTIFRNLSIKSKVRCTIDPS